MPRSKTQNQKIIDKRKDKILRSALTLFSLYGYYGTNIDDIGKLANCSRGLLYHYFNSKEELFHELMKKITAYIRTITNSINYENKAKDCLYELLDKFLKEIYSVNNKNFMASILYLLLNLPLQRKYLPKPKVKYDRTNCPIGERNPYNIICFLVEKGQKENDFLQGEPSQYTIAILTLLKGLAYNKLFDKIPKHEMNPIILMNIVTKRSENI